MTYNREARPFARIRANAGGYRGEVVLPTGEVDLRNRTDDPATGQFLEPDPLAGVVGTSTVTDPYHYANNDPVNNTDPLGLRPAKQQTDWRKFLPAAAGVVVGGVVTGFSPA